MSSMQRLVGSKFVSDMTVCSRALMSARRRLFCAMSPSRRCTSTCLVAGSIAAPLILWCKEALIVLTMRILRWRGRPIPEGPHERDWHERAGVILRL